MNAYRTSGSGTPARPGGRRRLWTALAVAAVLAVAGGLAVPHLAGGIARPRVVARLAALSERLGRPVAFSGLDASWRGVVRLHGVTLGSADGAATLVSVDRVLLAVAPMDLLRGRMRPSRVEMDGVVLDLDAAGVAELRDVATRMRGTGPGGDDADAGAGGVLPRILLHGGSVRVDLGAGRQGRLDGLDLELAREEGRRIDATFAGRLSIQGAPATAVTGTGSLEPGTGAFLAVEAAAPMQASLPGPEGVAVRLSGFSLDVDLAGRVADLAMRDLRVDGIGGLVGRFRPGRLADGGVFQAPDVRVTASFGEEGAGTGRLSRVRSLAVRHGTAAVAVAREPGLPLALRALSFDLDRNGDDGDFRLAVQATAALDGRGETRLAVTGVLDPDGAFRTADLSMHGPLAVQVASRVHPRVLAWPGADIDLVASLRWEGEAVSGTADLSAEGLTYFWTRVCLVPVTGLAFDARLEFAIDPAAGTVRVAAPRIRTGRATLTAEVSVRGLHDKPAIDAKLRIPRQSCEAVASAIPPVLIPRLEGALFEGEMDLAVDASVDLSRRGPKGEPLARFAADGDLESCRAITLGPRVRLKDLEGNRYVHVVREDDLDKPIRLGPGTSSYVPLAGIPDFVYQAALATEDMGFFEHQGFKPSLIRRALSMNVQYGWYVYGGSTISQQLVKNLYLSREKTLARKLEEAIVVWQMERLLEKERILELYLNCIEYGKHVYGIRAAARAYFNKEVDELTPLDAAFIMATKPKPRYAWTVYEKGEFTQWWVDRMQGILRRLWEKMAVIDEPTFLSAAPYLPLFWYPAEGAYRRPYTDPSVVVPQGMPVDLPRDEAQPAGAGDGGDANGATP
jgi:hypothetical protein